MSDEPRHLRDFTVPPTFPTFTASQLLRALLLVVSEDMSECPSNVSHMQVLTLSSDNHYDDDTRMYLCIQCLNRTLNGESAPVVRVCLHSS